VREQLEKGNEVSSSRDENGLMKSRLAGTKATKVATGKRMAGRPACKNEKQPYFSVPHDDLASDLTRGFEQERKMGGN
jgi:hypothetical protein